MDNQTDQYRAYLVRVWAEGKNGEGAVVWRCSLEDARTRRRRGFHSLESLFAFLAMGLSDQPEGECDEV